MIDAAEGSLQQSMMQSWNRLVMFLYAMHVVVTVCASRNLTSEERDEGNTEKGQGQREGANDVGKVMEKARHLYVNLVLPTLHAAIDRLGGRGPKTEPVVQDWQLRKFSRDTDLGDFANLLGLCQGTSEALLDGTPSCL